MLRVVLAVATAVAVADAPAAARDGAGIVQAMQDRTVSVIDFARSRLAWITKTGSRGYWTVAATATRETPGSAERTVLAPMVMAGNVYSTGRLPKEPPYSYQIYGSATRHAVLREPAATPQPGITDSGGPNESLFARFEISLAETPAAELAPQSLTVTALEQLWPLTARITARTGTGETWALEFPVLHINAATIDGKDALQVETGPILVPTALLNDDTRPPGQDFALAYVYFSRFDRADLLVWHADGGAARSYRRFARIENAAIRLFVPR
jgi:hypothetical protein